MAGQLKSLLRLAIFMAVAGGTIASLVLFLPVAAYYQTVDLAESRFDVQVDGLITPEIERAAEFLAEPGTVISFLTLNPATLEANGRVAERALVYFTNTPERINESWFPDSTVVTATSIEGDDWIDVSAQVARDLGLSPGASVDIPIVDQSVRLTVRRILAVARFGFRNVAVGPMNPAVVAAMSATESGATPSALLLQTSFPIDAVRAEIEKVSDVGATQVLSRREWFDQVDVDPTLELPVRTTATGLGLACLLGLAIREGHALGHRRRRDLAVLLAIGADRRKVVGSLVLIEAAAILIATALALVAVDRVVYRLVFAAVLPPPLFPALLVGLGGGGLAYLVALALTTWRRLQRFDVKTALSSP